MPELSHISDEQFANLKIGDRIMVWTDGKRPTFGQVAHSSTTYNKVTNAEVIGKVGTSSNTTPSYTIVLKNGGDNSVYVISGKYAVHSLENKELTEEGAKRKRIVDNLLKSQIITHELGEAILAGSIKDLSDVITRWAKSEMEHINGVYESYVTGKVWPAAPPEDVLIAARIFSDLELDSYKEVVKKLTDIKQMHTSDDYITRYTLDSRKVLTSSLNSRFRDLIKKAEASKETWIAKVRDLAKPGDSIWMNRAEANELLPNTTNGITSVVLFNQHKVDEKHDSMSVNSFALDNRVFFRLSDNVPRGHIFFTKNSDATISTAQVTAEADRLYKYESGKFVVSPIFKKDEVAKLSTMWTESKTADKLEKVLTPKYVKDVEPVKSADIIATPMTPKAIDPEVEKQNAAMLETLREAFKLVYGYDYPTSKPPVQEPVKAVPAPEPTKVNLGPQLQEAAPIKFDSTTSLKDTSTVMDVSNQIVDRLSALENKVDTQIQKVEDTKMTTAETSPVSFVEDVTNAATQAQWRIYQRQALKRIKDGLLMLCKQSGSNRAELQLAEKFLNSKIGEGMISALIGFGVSRVPMLNDNPKVVRLMEEFKVEGIAIVGDDVVERVIGLFLPILNDTLSASLDALPEVRFEVKEKPKKVRIKAPKKEKEIDVEAEEEAEAEEEETSKKRAKA